jgi:3'(2'), 5'-bisphosphate nucleotidase
MRRLDDGRETSVRVSGVTDPAAVVFCESVESAHTAHSWSGRVAEELGVHAEPLRMDSQCKYAAVARGDATAYLRLPTRPDYEERLWDHAAGLVVVTEAGGTVTDINGAALDVTAGPTLARNRGVVASNSVIHQALLDAIATARGS